MKKIIKKILIVTIVAFILICIAKIRTVKGADIYIIKNLIEFSIKDSNLEDIVGKTFLIESDDITDPGNRLYCVAYGHYLRDNGEMDPDDFIVDSGLSMSGQNFTYQYYVYDGYENYRMVKLEGTELLKYGNNPKEFYYNVYRMQYLLCNNNNWEQGYGDDHVRQRAVWRFWNGFRENHKSAIFDIYAQLTSNNSDWVINGWDSVDANDGKQWNDGYTIRDGAPSDYLDQNFRKEAEIYANVIKTKGYKSVQAYAKLISQKEHDAYNEFTIKYKGIITGIYDGDNNSLNENLKVKKTDNNKLSLANLNIAENETELTIRVYDKSITTIKVQVASTDTTFRMYHLQNKSIYYDENNKIAPEGCLDGWNSYQDNRFGQDLVYAYYNKSPDVTLEVTFNPPQEEPKTGTFKIIKVDKDTGSPLSNVWFGIEKNYLDAANLTSPENDSNKFSACYTSNEKGVVEFKDLDIGRTYSVWEYNKNTDYDNKFIWLAQIKITGEDSCQTISNNDNITFSKNEYTYTVENMKTQNTGGFTLTKYKEVGYNVAPFKDVTFAIKQEMYGSNWIFVKTDDAGKVNIEGLLPGKYYVYEFNSKVGYLGYNNQYIGYVDVTEGNNNSSLIPSQDLKRGIRAEGNKLYNKMVGQVTIKKVDQDGNPVSGIEFSLIRRRKSIYRS